MNWRDLLPLAAKLAAGATEAEWRGGVSRAYYAAFHVAREFFRALGFSVPRAEAAHQYMIFRLSNCGEISLQSAGQDLDALRRLRNQADYDDSPPMTPAKSITACRLAEKIIQALDGARQEPIRSQVIDTVKRYEQTVLRVTTWHP